MSRPAAIVAALLVLSFCAVLTSDGPAAAQTGPQLVLYQPPVRDGVVDAFRPPAHIGASGNRGLEYGTPFGRHVAAAADGVVTFAGQVAGRGAITVQHADGLRTTYTGLGDIWVSDGEFVEQGWVMGAAAEALHFGARIHDHYLDPQILIDASESTGRPHLVPAPDPG